METIRPQTVRQLERDGIAGLLEHLGLLERFNGEGDSWGDAIRELVDRVETLLPTKDTSSRQAKRRAWSETLGEKASECWSWVKKKYRRSATWALPIVFSLMSCLAGVAYYLYNRPGDGQNKPPPLPVLASSNSGVVEIATSAVRGFTAKLVLRGDGSLTVSNDRPPATDSDTLVRREFGHSLTYTPAEHAKGRRVQEVRHFDDVSVEQVLEDVATLVTQMESLGLKRSDIWVVISSGVAQVAKAKLPDEKTAQVEGWEPPKEVADACVADLVKRVRDKAGDVQDVRSVTPVQEATYLLREVFRQNERPQKDLESSFREVGDEVGDAVVIDVGSGNIKGAYINPGLGKFEGLQIDGIRRDIPGTKAFERLAAAEFARSARPDNPVEVDRVYKAAGAELVGKPLKDEYNNISMLGESRRVYLAGGAVWLMCRLTRPDADLDSRYVLLKGPGDDHYFAEDDFTRLRDRLVAEGDAAFEYPAAAVVGKPYEPTLKPRLLKLAGDPAREARYRKELQAVKVKFNRSQRLAAAEILNVIDDSLLRITKREVYFVNDGLFDYLASYLVEKVNEREALNRSRRQ
jgi:hypothetical protein